MSVHVSSFVWKHSEARLAERLVLLCLADKAGNDGGNVFPSVRTIARETRLSERAVQLALKNLRTAGRIARCGTHAQWKTTMYEIRMDIEAEGADPAPSEGADPAITPGAAFTPKPFLEAKPSSEPSSLKPSVPEVQNLERCSACGFELADGFCGNCAWNGTTAGLLGACSEARR